MTYEELLRDAKEARNLGDEDLELLILEKADKIRQSPGKMPKSPLGLTAEDATKALFSGVESGVRQMGRSFGIGDRQKAEEAAIRAEEAGPMASIGSFGAQALPVILGTKGLDKIPALATAGMKMAPRLAMESARAAAEGGLGGLLTHGDSDAEEAAKQGAGYGMGALGIGKALGGLGGLLDPGARRLIKSGVSMTPGQMVSRTNPIGAEIARGEEALTSAPFGGPYLAQARQRGIADLQNMMLKKAMPEGFALETTAPYQQVDEISKQFGERYRPILEGRQIKPDDEFLDAVGSAINAQQLNMPEEAARRLESKLGDFALRAGDQNADQFFRAQSDLAGDARNLGRSSTFAERAAGTAHQDAANAAYDMFSRQLPGGEQLQELRKYYRQFAPLKAAIDKARGEGGLTMAQLEAVAKKTGDKELLSLVKEGSRLLPSRLGESGTAPRSAILYSLANLAGTLSNPFSALPGAAAGLLSSGAGQKYAAGALPFQEALSRAMQKYGPGILGATMEQP